MALSRFVRRRLMQLAALPFLAALRLPRGANQVKTAHDQIRSLAGRAQLSLLFNGGSAEECRLWQTRFSRVLRSLLGSFRPPESWSTERERLLELKDHHRDELVLMAKDHPALPIYYLYPKTTKRAFPGILALHGHGPYGYDPVAGKAEAPEVAKAIFEANYDYGRQLVRRGYAVVVPCFTPFGRRQGNREVYGGEDICAVTFVRLQLLGKLLISENLRDALWALEFLCRQQKVDAERIGCVGLSYGGRMTMLTSALENRIKVAVVSGALNMMQERVQVRYSCGAQVIPGLLEYGDVPEIASLIAPRPCLWEVGSSDGLIDPSWAQTALKRIRKAYTALDADSHLTVDYFAGHHRWNGVKAYPMLDQVLRLS